MFIYLILKKLNFQINQEKVYLLFNFKGAFGRVRLAKKINDVDYSSTDTEEGKEKTKVRKIESSKSNSDSKPPSNLAAIKILSKQMLIKAK